MRIFFFLLLLLSAGCRETILHQLDEAKANQVQLLLSKRGIDATKRPDGAGWSLAVESGQVISALEEVRRARAIESRRDVGDKSEKGILQSPEERAYGFERELATQLENTLERLPHVLEARVHLHVESADFSPGSKSSSPVSASVLLITEGLVEQGAVQQLLSGASGVAADKVSVVFAQAETGNESLAGPLLENEASPVSGETANQMALNLGTWRWPVLGLGALLLVLIAGRRRKARGEPAPIAQATRQMSEQAGAEPLRPQLSPFEMNGRSPYREEDRGGV